MPTPNLDPYAELGVGSVLLGLAVRGLQMLWNRSLKMSAESRADLDGERDRLIQRVAELEADRRRTRLASAAALQAAEASLSEAHKWMRERIERDEGPSLDAPETQGLAVALNQVAAARGQMEMD